MGQTLNLSCLSQSLQPPQELGSLHCASKNRLTECRYLVQDHPAKKWSLLNWNPVNVTPKPRVGLLLFTWERSGDGVRREGLTAPRGWVGRSGIGGLGA